MLKVRILPDIYRLVFSMYV